MTTEPTTLEEAINDRIAKNEADAETRRHTEAAPAFAADPRYERVIDALVGPDNRRRREFEAAYADDAGLTWYEQQRSAAIAAGTFKPKGATK